MKIKCKVCGVEFEAENLETAVCPACGATGEDLEEVK